MKDTKKKKYLLAKSARQFSLIVFLVGVLGVIAAAYYAEAFTPKAGTISSACASGLTTISVALIGYAIFSLTFDTKHWRDYFAERLKEVILEQDYIETLDYESLKDLQTRTLKAQFRNQAIDKEGSFLKYFESNLHRFISEPFREDVSAEVLMKPCDDGTKLEVLDRVRYVCRSSGGRLQEKVVWRPDDGEFEDVKSLSILIQFPPGHQFAGEKRELFKEDGDKLKSCLDKGIEVSLAEYKEVDLLVVFTEAEYIVKLGKLQYWTMAHPTKNFDITITYPVACEIQFKTLVLEDVLSQVSEIPGYLKFGYGVWALPASGIAWVVSPCLKKPGEAQPSFAGEN
ncbi:MULTISPECIES: hypothetical protein [Delftia]|uniref:hypothetical protein n=1 Tax=Delftia TaxID=80865 RepID=UPI0012EEBE94|nr:MULTISPECIES: hypothetical protein [Delftia]MCP4014512.1 hypothetical protein [Delftia sp.]QPS75475.1 hypothetical protein I6G48_02605 [Delftia acidovorans]